MTGHFFKKMTEKEDIYIRKHIYIFFLKIVFVWKTSNNKKIKCHNIRNVLLLP